MLNSEKNFINAKIKELEKWYQYAGLPQALSEEIVIKLIRTSNNFIEDYEKLINSKVNKKENNYVENPYD